MKVQIVLEGKPAEFDREELIIMEGQGILLQRGQENHYVITPIYRRIILEDIKKREQSNPKTS